VPVGELPLVDLRLDVDPRDARFARPAMSISLSKDRCCRRSKCFIRASAGRDDVLVAGIDEEVRGLERPSVVTW
jgi:hypothetical protein